MSAIVSIVAKVMLYIIQVVFWLFFVKAVEKSFQVMKGWHLPRLRSVKA